MRHDAPAMLQQIISWGKVYSKLAVYQEVLHQSHEAGHEVELAVESHCGGVSRRDLDGIRWSRK